MTVPRRARAALIAIVLAGLALVGGVEPAAARAFVDSAGRRVEVPDKIARAFAAGGPASVLLYAIAPDRMVGWTRALTAAERVYIPAPYADLPTLGRLTGRANTANVEVVLRTRPDVIVDYGSVLATYVSLADRVQSQTSVPYVLLDGSLSATPAAFRALGELLGVGARAETLARYADRVLGEVDRRVASPGCRRRVGRACTTRGDPAASRPACAARSTSRASSGSARATSRPRGSAGAASRACRSSRSWPGIRT
jgi:iron complex transport system substrate-binding protein